MSKPSTSSNFAVYQRFNRREDLADVVEILRANNISVRVSDGGEEIGEWTEKVIMGSPLRPKFWIEIPEQQFEKANFMLQEAAEANLDEEILDEHPFNEYSVNDLQSVLINESDWSPEAVVIARRLLLRRGSDVDLKRLRDAARARLAAEYEPVALSGWVLPVLIVVSIAAGLLVSFVGVMIVLGLLLYYAFGVRRDPKGNLHDVYNSNTRSHSRLALGILVVATFLGLLNMFYLKWIVVPDIDGWLWWWR